jgi:lipid A 3-O-deacylase
VDFLGAAMNAGIPLLAGVLAAVGVVGGSYVQPTGPMAHHSYASVSAGYFDVFDNNEKDSSADFRAEYTFAHSLYSAGIVSVHPFLGVEGTTDGSFYGLGGLKFEAKYNNFYLTPSIGVGAYYSGDGKNMGSPLEFRSQIETGYEFSPKGNRLGVAISHISNADVANTNPGAEVVSVYYHLPINW